MSSVQNVLFEYTENDELFTSSGILFGKRWILLPAAPLLVAFDNKANENLKELETSRLYTTNLLNLAPESLQVALVSKGYQSVKYVGIFSCTNISGTTDFPLACGDNNDFTSLLSLFILFDLNLEQKFKVNELLASVRDLLALCEKAKNLNRGSGVFVESNPFGSRDLLASYSQGVVCSNFGVKDCFVLIDAATAPGSEGAPIFSLKSHKSSRVPIGLIISSINSWRGEHTGLTLGAMLIPLLSQLLPNTITLKNYLFSQKNSILNTVDKSIVQVYCGNGWGTGLLINQRRGIFITGSHVVKSSGMDPIVLKWRNKKFPGALIYRTTETPVFDIAVLKCSPLHIQKMTQLRIASAPAKKGENVLAAGYPIFKMDDTIFPVVTKGNISLVHDCILHTTCCVLPGSSGGAILRESGELLAVIVCHTTVTIKNQFVVYPKINMAIPMRAIKKPLLDYIKNNNAACLKDLKVTDSIILNKWHLFRAKL